MTQVSFNPEYLARIARVCHEANKSHCESHGDFSQKSWDEAEEWQRESAKKGVAFAINNPNAPESSQHDAWMQDKINDGWVYGEVKDAEKKTHPCIVPFNELPVHQQEKDRIFRGIVRTMAPPRELLNPKVVGAIEPGATYDVPSYRVTDQGMENAHGTTIKFCKGNKEDASVPRQEGVFTETLISVAKHYLETVNVGEMASRETSMVITKLDEALMWIDKRAADRKIRGVQGTYRK